MKKVESRCLPERTNRCYEFVKVRVKFQEGDVRRNELIRLINQDAEQICL